MLAQLVEIFSGKPRSGFPGRRVRSLKKEVSLGSPDDAVQNQIQPGIDEPGAAPPPSQVEGSEVLSNSDPDD